MTQGWPQTRHQVKPTSMLPKPERTHLMDPSRQWPPNSSLSKLWGADTQGTSFVTLYNGPKFRHMDLQVNIDSQRELYLQSLIFLNDCLSDTEGNAWLTEAGWPPQRQSGFSTHAVKVTNVPTSRNKSGTPSRSFAGQQRLQAHPSHTTNARSFQRSLVPSRSKHTKP